jgi:hypothetical protein
MPLLRKGLTYLICNHIRDINKHFWRHCQGRQRRFRIIHIEYLGIILHMWQLGHTIDLSLIEAYPVFPMEESKTQFHDVSPWVGMRLQLASPLILNLYPSLFATPSLDDVVSTRLIPDTWGFLMGVCSIIVLWLVLHGATTKPGASCGAWHKVVLLGTRRYQGLLVMIHYGATPMCYLLVNLFLGYHSLSYQKISTSNQEISFF